MKRFLKLFLETYAPRLRFAITSYRHKQLWRRKCGAAQALVRKQLFGKGPIHVLSGPFGGLSYIDEIVWGPITPKWLGSYECELHDIIDNMIRAQEYASIVDIGAVEGYYAVGLARAFPRARVRSYDVDFRGRRQQRRLARLNRVSNLKIDFLCTPEKLRRDIQGRTLVICDIEGFEMKLMDPSLVPPLAGCDMLVEIHHFETVPAEDVLQTLASRFASTHRVQSIESGGRDPVAWKACGGNRLAEADLMAALDEMRAGKQHWLWLTTHL